jgi:hypothetical protein
MIQKSIFWPTFKNDKPAFKTLDLKHETLNKNNCNPVSQTLDLKHETLNKCR